MFLDERLRRSPATRRTHRLQIHAKLNNVTHSQVNAERESRLSIEEKARALGLDIEAPDLAESMNDAEWYETADLVVVGLGGAGIAASLEAIERGLSVIAVDRYDGGGSTAANGGVFYAGGGTSIQKDAGEDDSPEEMYKYLKMEAGDVVSDATLRRFVDESVPTVDWIQSHGGMFNSRVWKQKASYPPLSYFLYHSDNSLVGRYREQAKPAARGHRAYARNGKKAWGLGRAIYEPLRDAALRQGLRFHRLSEARRLLQDEQGRVIGVEILSIPEGSTAAKHFRTFIRRAAFLFDVLPVTFPLSSWTFALGNFYLRKAREIEETSRTRRRIRARKGVLLSAGGFAMNRKMVEEYAPRYKHGMPNGTLGDQGSGIFLGMSVGGSTDRMDKISAWRFINPPKAWSDAIVVNARGERFIDETVYGATMGEHIGEHQGGTAFVVYDARLRKAAFRQAFDRQLVPFQRDVALINLLFNARKAPDIVSLAEKTGMDASLLSRTIAEYNEMARGSRPDPFGKGTADMQPLERGPFYAMDISIVSRFLPLPIMSFGGLRVDEDSGLVLGDDDRPVAGLYAAGRSAVGIPSQTYVSGLSFADCFFSGRRVARHAAGTGT